VDPAARPLARGDRGSGHDRARNHGGGDDHGLRLPRIRPTPGAADQDLRAEPRERRVPRRIRGPESAAAGGARAPGPADLVAPGRDPSPAAAALPRAGAETVVVSLRGALPPRETALATAVCETRRSDPDAMGIRAGFSPQRTVELPEGNLFGVPAQTATFTAHARGAVIRRLRPGQHTVTIEVAPDLGGACTFRVFVNVVRGGPPLRRRRSRRTRRRRARSRLEIRPFVAGRPALSGHSCLRDVLLPRSIGRAVAASALGTWAGGWLRARPGPTTVVASVVIERRFRRLKAHP
jgi:hypothetical protein